MVRYTFILLVISGLANAQSQDGVICWNGVKCLTVDDFRGDDVPDSITLILEGKRPPAAATIFFGTHFVSYDTINVFRFVGYFDTNLSWIDKDGALLSHEQTHFNIQELIVRRTNKLLDSIFYNVGEKIDYDSLMDNANNKVVIMNSKFDSETKYGSRSQLNRDWVHKIAKEVDQLEEYGIYCDD